MTLGTVEWVGDDLLHRSPLVWFNGTVADQPCMNPPVGQAEQPETVHRDHAEPMEVRGRGGDISKIMGGGSWPEGSLEGATVTNPQVPGTQGSCLLVSP